MFPRLKSLPVAVAVALALSPLAAQAESLGVIQVESSTIGDRFEDKRAEPSAIAAISGEEVDSAHTENIQQMLQSIPGVTTEFSSGDTLKIHIRGVENQMFMGEKPGVAIVIDGVPVFERTGKVNIDMDNIESIKVVKGGASFLFGEDALAGAVIITTKRGAQYDGVKVQAEGGSFGYKKGLVRVGKAAENWNGHIQASTRQSDGYYFDSDYKADYVNGKFQYYLSDSSDLTFGFEHSDRDKDSHGTVTGETQADNDPESVAGRDYVRMFDVELSKLFATYSRDMGESSNLMVNVYQFTDDTQYVSAPQRYDLVGNIITDVDAYTTGNDYDQVQRGLKSEWRTSGDEMAWMAGIDLRQNSYENYAVNIIDYGTFPSATCAFIPTCANFEGEVNDDNKTEEGVQALYGEAKFRVSDPMTVTVNGRYDNIDFDYTDNLTSTSDTTDFQVASYRLGMNYSLSKQRDIYANYSTGFRTPNVEQLFVGDDTLGDTIAANSELDPEHSINLELGLRQKSQLFGIEHDIDVAVFNIDRKDMIMSSAGNYTKTTAGGNQFENIGSAQHRGLELSIKSDAAKKVSWDVAYTYLDATYTDYDNFSLVLGNPYSGAPGAWSTVAYDNTGNKIPRVSDHHLNLKLKVRPASGWLVTGEMDAISDYYADDINQEKIDGHEVFNLLVNYDRNIGGNDWSFFARVDNVFDRKYYNVARGFYDADYDMDYDSDDLSIVVNQGRTFTMGLSANF